MCAVVAILAIKGEPHALRARALQLARRVRHRGPDWSGIYADDQAVLAHERLAIVDVESGAQPLQSDSGKVLCINGEIYNHQELRSFLSKQHDFKTASDCEVLMYLYEEQGVDFLQALNGIFAFVLYDRNRHSYLVARDAIGVVPLYYGHDDAGSLYVASELKAIAEVCTTVQEFPPGHYSLDGELRCWFKPGWMRRDFSQAQKYTTPKRLRVALENAVRRQLMCDVPFGLLISGGVDSSIIAAIAARFAAQRVEDGSAAWWPRLHSFTIGLPDAPDLEAAHAVAEHIGTVHHAFTFSVQEGLDALADVIYHLETFDTTTVRASVPMYLMARKIKAMGIKMVLSGEGADEVFGGYLYFHQAPNAHEFHRETLRKIKALHRYDCLRANKAMAAWGVEARVPFLDVDFLNRAMNLHPQTKMPTDTRMEKHLLRQTFADYLPHAIVWRQKEQFSDGVGYRWIEALQEHAATEISAQQFAARDQDFPQKTPQTKEEYLYRQIYAQFFAEHTLDCVPHEPSIACSSAAALAWDARFAEHADPSGRAVRDLFHNA